MFAIKLSMKKQIKNFLAAWFSDLPAINATVFNQISVFLPSSVVKALEAEAMAS